MKLYIITYNLHSMNNGMGSFYYATKPKFQMKTFFEHERQEWLIEYERLKKDGFFYSDVKSYALMNLSGFEITEEKMQSLSSGI